jgi:hypothetical protein
VELHHRPKWPAGFPAPPLDDVFAHAVPGPADGVLAPDPAHHAVLLTGHAWAHGPLRRVGDLVDVAAMGHAEDAGRIAEAWGCERLWRTTARATEGLLGEAPPPACLKLWARHLRDVRSRTVAEAHLATWLAPGWAAPRRRLRAVMTATRQDLTPGGDGWTAKARRARRAAAGGLTAKDAYDAGLPFEEREPALAAARARRHGGSHGA